MTSDDLASLPGALARLREAVDGTSLPLALPGVDNARGERIELLHQLDDYIIPRAHNLDAPLLVVVGGSTGAGKSTLVNSVVGSVVTQPGVLRPTTRASTLVHHPDDARWFTDQRVLPELARVTGAGGQQDPKTLRLVASDAVPEGLALLDAPDIDSVVSANRDLARQLLAAADLWIFVTTATRYADAVPWELLRQAAERGTSLAMVLDRVPDEHIEIVRDDLAAMLAEQGLGRAQLFVVPESRLDAGGYLPDRVVEPIQTWLVALAADQQARADVIRRTLGGALDSLTPRVSALQSCVDEQLGARDALQRSAADAFGRALDGVSEGVQDGSLLRGEVLARWQDFVGTGELLRQLEGGVSKVRDRVTAALRGRGKAVPAAKGLEQALQSGVAALVTSHAESASVTVTRAWRGQPGGAPIVQRHGELATPSTEFQRKVEVLVREWQDDVLQLVRDEAGGRRTTARFLAFGISGIGAMLMIITFSMSYGLSGAEVGIAGGSAVLAQRVLEAVFGDQAVRTLAVKARELLLQRVKDLYDAEQGRFERVLVDETPGLDAGARVVPALSAVKAAR